MISLPRRSVSLLLGCSIGACNGSNAGDPEHGESSTGASGATALDTESGGPSGSTIDGGDAPTSADGSAGTDGDASDGGDDSGGGDAVPIVTYDVAQESNEGTDSCVAWQTAFLIDDGRIVSFGTGNHNPEQTNAMRCIDPVTMPDVVQSYDLFPWTQENEPPDQYSGHNAYVSNYDNHPSMYLPGDDAVLWAGHGIFDVGAETWTHGDRPPLSDAWSDYVDNTDSPGSHTTYNPGTAWCAELGVGVWFGGSGGGYGVEDPQMVLIEANAGNAAMPWRLSLHEIAGVADFENSRNTAACVGTRLYMGGPTVAGGRRFFEIDVETKTLVAERAALPEVDDHYAQIVYDAARDRLVLIGMGVFLYDFDSDTWRDVTPDGWPGYQQVNGIYHPELDAIFFRGILASAPEDFAACFSWHRMEFAD